MHAFRNDRVQRSKSNRSSYRYQMASVSAAFTFFFSISVTVLVFGPGPLAVGSSVFAALFGFVVAVSLLSELEEVGRKAGDYSSLGSVVMQDEIRTSAASVLRSLKLGLIAATVSAIVTGVAFLLSVLKLPPLNALDIVALAMGLVTVSSAIHTSSLLLGISRKSEGTVWRGPLLRAKV